MNNILKLIRPYQWVKNVVVLLPIFFGGHIFDGDCWIAAAIVCVIFCLAASSIYSINDVADRDADRMHPVKCMRPVASGSMSVCSAILTSIILGVSAIGLCYAFCNWNILFIIGLYLILNVLYGFKLKQYGIIDMMTVAFGFVLRLLAGGIATGIPLSPWIVIMTFMLTLLMIISKRRSDLLLYIREQIVHRTHVVSYTPEFLMVAMAVVASVTIVCYVMYTLSPEVVERFHSEYLYITTLLVLVGIMRYLQLVIINNEGSDPTKLAVKDPTIVASTVIWLLSFAYLIYL